MRKKIVNLGGQSVLRNLSQQEEAQRQIEEIQSQLQQDIQANKIEENRLREAAIEAIIESYRRDVSAPTEVKAYLAAKG